MSEARVLIVGAGPVGMTAAAYLADEGIPVTIIDAHRDVPTDLRASTFHPPTLDMLDRFGIGQKCVEQGLICPQWQFRDRREGVIATFDLSLLKDETNHPYRLQCEQWKLSLLLRDWLRAHPNADVVFGARAVDVTQDDDGVTLIVEREDGTREPMRGRYMVSADGARSNIRKALGVTFEGMTIPEIFLSMSTTFPFHEAIDDLANIAYISDPDEWVVLLRTPSLWRVLLPTDPSETPEQMKAPARVEERLQAVFPKADPYDVVHSVDYRVHEKVAENYVVGRVFLAGDAAHLNNPLGGMGMNGGIHDAMNLAEKLTQVWHGAPLSLMGRYERQRRKVAVETVQAQALRNRSILNERSPDARRAYHDELRATVADPAQHKAYVMRSSLIQSLRDLEGVE
ncbi:MAG: putative oxidoreductase [Rhodobacteraceae bacterium HLUCCA12]|nr:MAG: putative oxidoreductase [Rhodobacteraceae bacterium HLUCCA12]